MSTIKTLGLSTKFEPETMLERDCDGYGWASLQWIVRIADTLDEFREIARLLKAEADKEKAE
jgi:hypothetical protein